MSARGPVMKRQENRPQFRGLVKRALGFSLGRSGGEGSGVVRRLARAFVIRCVLGRTIFRRTRWGLKSDADGADGVV